VQPDPQFPPRLDDDIAFNGDGMISRFHIHDGQCDFRQRWAVPTSGSWNGRRAGAVRRLSATPSRMTNRFKGRIRGTANTNAWIHGGRLYALKEDSPALS